MEQLLCPLSTLESANDDDYPDEPIDWIDSCGLGHSGRRQIPCVPSSTYPGQQVWPISGRWDYTVMRGSREYILRTSQGRLRWADTMMERYLRRFHRGIEVGEEAIRKITAPLLARITDRFWIHDNTVRAVEKGWLWFYRDDVVLINGRVKRLSPEQMKTAREIRAQVLKWEKGFPLPG